MAYEQEVERYLKTSIWKLTKGTQYLYKRGVNFTDIRIQHYEGWFIEIYKGHER